MHSEVNGTELLNLVRNVGIVGLWNLRKVRHKYRPLPHVNFVSRPTRCNFNKFSNQVGDEINLVN